MTEATQTLIEIPLAAKDLSLRAGGHQILTKVSLGLGRGEFVGLIGGSGSGKTTLMKCLAGILKPSDGLVAMNGYEPNAELRRNLIGFVPQDDIVHQSLTVETALVYACMLRIPDTDRKEAMRRVDKVLEILELVDHRKKRVRRLSGGQRKRVNIGMELLHAPKLFFLDEPTAGLDPSLERQIMHFLKSLADTQRLVLVTTHVLYNVDLFDQLVFVHQGHLVYYGPADQILAYFRVKQMADIYDIVARHTPKDLANTYQNSTLYRSLVSDRLKRLS